MEDKIRIDRLRARHEDLEVRIEELSRRPSSPDAEIRRLKVRKLAVKDRIAGHVPA